MDIYNPLDFPFGILSNHALYDMVIDGKNWGTVTNYVCSNFLTTPLYRNILHITPIKGSQKSTNIENKVNQIVANIQSKRGLIDSDEVEKIRSRITAQVAYDKLDIYGVLDYFVNQEYEDALKNGIDKAYNTKAMEDKEFVKALLSTENRPISFISDNEKLSTYISTVLMQLRKNLKTVEKAEKTITNKEILNIYRAMTLLQKELTNLNDLSEYVGKNAEQVVSFYLASHQDENLVSLNLDNKIEDDIVSKYKLGSLPYIAKEYESPSHIVYKLRKDNLRLIKQAREELKNRIIVSRYTQYMIKSKYPNMDDEAVKEASFQLFTLAPNPKIQNYEDLAQRILSLYLKGLLPEGLNEKIRDSIKDIKEISDKDIERAEQMIYIPEREIKEEKSISASSSSSTEDEDNGLKQALRDDNDKKKRQFELAKDLENMTGLRTWYQMSLSDLENEISKYKKGIFGVYAKISDGRELRIGESKSNKVPKSFIEETISQYNLELRSTGSNPVSILANQVYFVWEPEYEKKETLTEKVFKPVGEVLQIFSDYKKTDPKYAILSTNFPKVFVVDNLAFPSIEIYLGSLALTKTGISSDIRREVVHKRGMDIVEARRILMIDNKELRDKKVSLLRELKEEKRRVYPFVAKEIDRLFEEKKISTSLVNAFIDPKEIPKLYKRRLKETKNELFPSYAKAAMNKKFSDIGLMKILSMTGKANLRWIEPKDLVLGYNIKKNIGNNMAGKILMSIRENIPPFVNLSKNISLIDIQKLCVQDEFMNKWFSLKLKDLSNLVFKFKKYLEDIGKQQTTINSEFVDIILRIVYKNCQFLKSETKIPMPEEFVNEVKNTQKGLAFKFSQNYEKLIQEKIKLMERNETQIFGSKAEEKVELKIDSVEDYYKNLESKTLQIYESYVKDLYPNIKKQNEVMDEIKKYLKKETIDEDLLASIETVIQSAKEDIEEYTRYLDKIFSGEDKVKQFKYKKTDIFSEEALFVEELENSEEIRAKIEKERKVLSETKETNIEEKLSKLRNKLITQKLTEYRESKYEKKETDWEKFLYELESPKFNREQIKIQLDTEKKRLEKKKVDQDQIEAKINAMARNLRNIPKYSMEEKSEKIKEYRESKLKRPVFDVEDRKQKLARLEEMNKQVKEQIIFLNAKRKKEQSQIQDKVRDIARVYWNHISSILNFIIVTLNNPTEDVLKKTLIGIDIVLKNRNPRCDNLPQNLKDDMENCVVSALANILRKIMEFKHEYKDDLPFGTHDIDLARLILLGKGTMKREDGAVESVLEDEDEKKEDGEMDKEEKEREEKEEREYEDIEDVESENESAEFGIQNPVEEKELIRIILSEVLKKNVGDRHVEYFIDTVDKVIESKISQELKMARINFYATLK